MVKIKLQNKKRLEELAKYFKSDANKGIEDGMKAIGMHLRNVIIRDITKRSPGSTKAVRYQPKRNVKVSPPGTSPNNDTGELRRSIQWDLLDSDKVVIGSDIWKGMWLEMGTKKMKPRPFIYPNAVKELDNMEDVMFKAIEKRIRKDWVKRQGSLLRGK